MFGRLTMQEAWSVGLRRTCLDVPAVAPLMGMPDVAFWQAIQTRTRGGSARMGT